jgi:hypothetical protein
MKAGALEFLTKPFRDQDLLDAIHHLTTQELDGNRIECSHRSGVARAAEVFRKISQNFSPPGVTSPFVARAMPTGSGSVGPVSGR